MPQPVEQASPFVPYGPSHWAALAVFAAGAVALVLVGRRLRGRPAELAFSRSFALLLLLTQLAFQVYAMLPRNWGLEHSLPLELCDLAWMAAGVALWTRARWACVLLYYWGLTLTAQALVTPSLAVDFPSLTYLMFFTSHNLTVWAAVYLTWGAGVARPTWRLLAMTLAVTVAWGLIMMVFNALAGTNYVFVNRKPPAASVLDYFGPWPYYLAVEVAIGAAVWALLTLPWQLAAGRRRPLEDAAERMCGRAKLR